MLDQFRPPSLESKVGLRKGDFLFFGIAVLRNQVAGVASEHNVIHLALAARTEIDHFVDLNKMVGERVIRNLAGSFCLADDRRKVTPFHIAKEMLKVSCEPEFDSVFGLLRMCFEGAGQRMDKLSVHGQPFRSSC